MDLRAAFESLSQAERDTILDPKGAFKAPVNDINKFEGGTVSTTTSENFSEHHIPKDDMAEGEVVSFFSIIYPLELRPGITIAL